MSAYFDCKHLEADVQPDNVHVLTVKSGIILDDVAHELRRDVTLFLDQAKPDRLVLDLQRVNSISSMGIGVLISLLRRMRESGGRLVLCGMSPGVSWTLRLCKLIDDTPQEDVAVFCHTADVPTALARLK